MAISRRREFLADANSALLTRYPDGLIRALQKISADSEPLEVANRATAHLYFASPFQNKRGVPALAKMFMSHPPVEERIAALRQVNIWFMFNIQGPKIDNDFAQLTGDSLQQAWRGEAKQQRWRRAYWSLAIIILIIMIGGLLVIGWPSFQRNLSNWSAWIKDKTGQTVDNLQQWQLNNERSIIEGNILK